MMRCGGCDHVFEFQLYSWIPGDRFNRCNLYASFWHDIECPIGDLARKHEIERIEKKGKEARRGSQ